MLKMQKAFLLLFCSGIVLRNCATAPYFETYFQTSHFKKSFDQLRSANASTEIWKRCQGRIKRTGNVYLTHKIIILKNVKLCNEKRVFHVLMDRTRRKYLSFWKKSFRSVHKNKQTNKQQKRPFLTIRIAKQQKASFRVLLDFL